MKISICGDSFAADWSIKYQQYPGWCNLLAKDFDVKNHAQAGCSEYKIWLQIINADLSDSDVLILWHTSPYRIPIDWHPIHHDDVLHRHCDLIYEDIRDRSHPDLKCASVFYEKFFNLDHATLVHQLMIDHQNKYLTKNFSGKTLHIKCPDSAKENSMLYIDLDGILEQHAGLINHMDSVGNVLTYDIIKSHVLSIVN